MSHPHNFTGVFAGFTYCLRCGLIWLKNAASAKAIKKPCPGGE